MEDQQEVQQEYQKRAFVTLQFDGQKFLLPKEYENRTEALVAINRWKCGYGAYALPDYVFGVLEVNFPVEPEQEFPNDPFWRSEKADRIPF